MQDHPTVTRWPTWSEIARTTALVMFVVSAFVVMFAVVRLASLGIVTILVGILVAVLFDAGARGLGHIVPWNRHVRLLIVFILSIALVVAAIWWGGTVLAEQANNFYSAMKQLWQRANDVLNSGGFGLLPKGSGFSQLLPDGSALFGGATTLAAGLFAMISITAAILFLGAFLAWEPEVYKTVILSVLPQDKRERVDEVLDMSAHAMREWLIGQSISMSLIFIFSFAALELVGMPYPVLLAVQAGLLTFIPTLGPFFAGVVIILAGLSQNLEMALYGLCTYVLIQFLETHLITPLVQERTIRLAPAVTLGLQVISAFLFGILGVAFVVPMAAAGKVLIEELYVKDRLGGGWEPRNGHPPSFLSRWIDQLSAKLRRRG